MQLHVLQKRVESQSEEGENETSFPELLGHLSPPSPQRLDQVKALIIATESFRGEWIIVWPQLEASTLIYTIYLTLN